MNPIKKWLLFGVQLSVTLLLLALIFRRDEFREDLWLTVRDAHPGWLAAAVLGAFLVNFLAWLRWWICLRVLGLTVPAGRSIGFFAIGLFASLSFLGPMGGDAVRLGLLWRDGHPRTLAAMSVVLDRMSGLISLIIGSAVFTIFRHDWFLQDATSARLVHALWGYLAAVAVFFIATLVATRRGWLHHLPAWIPGRVHLLTAGGAWDLFFRRGRLVLATVGLSMGSLMIYFFVFAFCADAFRLEISWLDLFGILPIVDVAAALPISFAGLGVREMLFDFLLVRLAGTSAASGVLIGFGGFACMTVWSLAGGLYLPGYRAQTGRHISLSKLAHTP